MRYLNVLVSNLEEVDNFICKSRRGSHALLVVHRPFSFGRVLPENFECCEDLALVLGQKSASLQKRAH